MPWSGLKRAIGRQRVPCRAPPFRSTSRSATPFPPMNLRAAVPRVNFAKRTCGSPVFTKATQLHSSSRDFLHVSGTHVIPRERKVWRSSNRLFTHEVMEDLEDYVEEETGEQEVAIHCEGVINPERFRGFVRQAVAQKFHK